MVLAFNGRVLMFLCLYAFINAVGGFLAGGHEPELDRHRRVYRHLRHVFPRTPGSGRICRASTPRVG